MYTLFYDGINFQLLGEGGEYGTALAPQVLPGYTIGTDGGLVSGTYSNIKSLQRGTTILQAVSKTVAISSIDPNISIIEISASERDLYTSSSPANSLVSAKINSATELQFATCVYNASAMPEIAYTVTEFNGVKSKQSGVKQCTSDGANTIQTFTQALTVVDASKCILRWSMRADMTTSISIDRLNVQVQLSNNQITIKMVTVANYSYYIEWQVLEFK